MAELVVLLLPEMLGLVVTPAAVVACFLLLGSTHPLRNVATFAAAFLGCYLVICVVTLAVGRAAGATEESSSAVRTWIGLGVGLLFLAAAALMLLRPAKPRPDGPGWVTSLQHPTPPLLLASGVVLSLVNPNIAILGSGLGMVLASDVDESGQVLGVVLLLSASALDFLVPVTAYVVSGERGRRALAGFTRWLVVHNRGIGIGVLLGFGLLFCLRGVAQLV